jgi:hypothetical protein
VCRSLRFIMEQVRSTSVVALTTNPVGNPIEGTTEVPRDVMMSGMTASRNTASEPTTAVRRGYCTVQSSPVILPTPCEVDLEMYKRFLAIVKKTATTGQPGRVYGMTYIAVGGYKEGIGWAR